MIPAVHVTELKQYLRCSLAHFWSSTRGLNLERKIPKAALQLGTLVHQALEAHYSERVSPVTAFTVLALKEQARLEEAYGKLWPEQLATLQKDLEIGLDMMRGYEEWRVVADAGKTILATETPWRLKLTRQLWLAGRFDLIVEDSNGLWVLDFKTTTATNTDWTRQDLQGTVYVCAARKLYGASVQGIIYRFLRKKVPETYEKLILKSGKVSRKKSLPNVTTLREYERALALAALKPLYPDHSYLALSNMLDEGIEEDAKALWQSDYTMLRKEYWEVLSRLKEAENPFFKDVVEYRTSTEVNNYMRYLVLPKAKEMTSKKRNISPTGLGAAYTVCRNCSFRLPCQLAMEGGDFKSILREDYQQREAR